MERTPPDWRAIDDEEEDANPDEPTQRDAHAGSPASPRPRDDAGSRSLVPAAALGLAALLGGAALLWSPPQDTHVALEGGNALPSQLVDVGSGSPGGRRSSSASPSTETAWFVDVEGGVTRPGVYRLKPGSRVADAISAAGGFSGSVDTRAVAATVNLAGSLDDGTKLVIPQLGDVAAAATQPPPGPGAGASMGTGAASGVAGNNSGAGANVVDINRASQSELEALPGIGPVTAGKILAARAEAPFGSVDELRDRKLVGPATFEKIRELVTVGG